MTFPILTTLIALPTAGALALFGIRDEPRVGTHRGLELLRERAHVEAQRGHVIRARREAGYLAGQAPVDHLHNNASHRLPRSPEVRQRLVLGEDGSKRVPDLGQPR